MQYETVIGYEVHVELGTDTKVFCGCSTRFGQPPNTEVCPVCLGMPGSLPVLNRKAFDFSLRAAVALNCRINPLTDFERKNYYYPDLPKNYQISQLRRNLGEDGYLEIPINGGADKKKIRINNIHLEEDAGKNVHPEGTGEEYSLVDLNRAGTPLLEIVSEPDIRTAEEARPTCRRSRACSSTSRSATATCTRAVCASRSTSRIAPWDRSNCPTSGPKSRTSAR
jgi:aspartyl-tRNA(Asn)/glutamyl-tRNA(Gln) amidotransferase subunit B